jgi:steroid delta-isomerase-like uncharacterized protein
MDLENSKTIVRGYLNEIVNNANMDAFETYLSPDVVFNNTTGVKEQFARLQTMRIAFPDFHLVIEDQIAEGGKVVTRVTFHGTHQGEFNGVAPTGRRVEWPGIAIDRIAGDKVVEMWHVQNMLAVMKQIC